MPESHISVCDGGESAVRMGRKAARKCSSTDVEAASKVSATGQLVASHLTHDTRHHRAKGWGDRRVSAQVWSRWWAANDAIIEIKPVCRP